VIHRVLLIDASTAQRDALELALDPAHWLVHVAPDAGAALAALDHEDFDVALCDDAIPGLDGFDLVPQLLRKQSGLRVLLAASADRPDRHEAGDRLGVAGVLARPFHLAELRFAMRRSELEIAERHRATLVEQDLARVVGDKPLVAASEAMIELLEGMERTAGFKTPALLRGEPGTHREVLARAIHAQSARRTGPFVGVRCNASDREATERALFGSASAGAPSHRTAGRLSLADGGTAYLDDLTALSQASQERLLHLLETGELLPVGAQKGLCVDVRVIVAATEPIEEAVEAGRVRADLAARLGDAVLDVPALRERRADLPLLVDHLVARFTGDLGAGVQGVSDSAMERLLAYAWPGNLRELENVIERAVLLATTDRITVHELTASLATTTSESGAMHAPGDFSLRRARRSFEADMIRRALARTNGNRTRAAKLLEISHRALLYKIKEYGLRD
jgi:two-component system response regulator AtoC